jgi:DNA polymerase III subunit gamma/tau
VQLLKARLKNGTALDTSYIFSGGSGQGKCVVGDTLVSTDLGLKTIQSLMGPNQVDPSTIKVLQEYGESQAAYTYRGGVRETIRIRTHHGFELEGTPNHRILVMLKDGTIDWKRLDDLYLGDQCCLLPRGLFGRRQDLSGWSYPRSDKDFSSIEFSPPSDMTPELARLIGYLIGDGDCKSSKVVLSCAEHDIIQDQHKLLTRIFGGSSITPDTRRFSLVAVRCLRVQPRSFLKYCGVDSVDAGSKSVPWSILQSPKHIIREFLRGYLESDGGPVVGSGGVEFSSKSKKLAQQVQVLLLQFGILSRLYPKVVPEYGVYWRCQIYGTDVADFEREVGFISARKSKALSKIVKSCRGLTRLIPSQKQHLRLFYRSLPKTKRSRTSSDMFRSKKDCSKSECSTAILKLAVAYDPDNQVTSHFNNLLQLGFVYSPVASIEVGEAEVYDLNVPDGERFSANGFINHNTTIARIFARAMLCENLDKSNPEPCNQCESCKSILNDSSVAFSELDAASQGGIDQIRRIVDSLPFTVIGASKRIYLYDESHRMSKDAQDVLLKPLEERKMIGMFCTTEPEKVRGAIRSRCEEYGIRKVTREDVLVRMKHILESEGVEYEDDGVLTVIDYAGGHVRDVVSRLEMIAQVGSISLDNVREHLNLSVISTYYQILLNLTQDIKKALQLVDQACERVTAEEVASGLSEAAMNAFRLANGMGADFAFTDTTLATEVYKLYGVDLIKIANHFLRSRFVTQVSLICDVTTLAYSGVKSSFVSQQPVILAPIVQIDAPSVVHQRQNVIEPSPASVVPTITSAPPLESTTSSIGNLGSSDPEARTIYDSYVIPEGNPGKKRKPTQIPLDVKTSSDRDLLTHEMWRRGFTELWSRGKNG